MNKKRDNNFIENERQKINEMANAIKNINKLEMINLIKDNYLNNNASSDNTPSDNTPSDNIAIINYISNGINNTTDIQGVTSLGRSDGIRGYTGYRRIQGFTGITGFVDIPGVTSTDEITGMQEINSPVESTEIHSFTSIQEKTGTEINCAVCNKKIEYDKKQLFENDWLPPICDNIDCWAIYFPTEITRKYISIIRRYKVINKSDRIKLVPKFKVNVPTTKYLNIKSEINKSLKLFSIDNIEHMPIVKRYNLIKKNIKIF